jgi:hypothetical protein
MPEGLTDLEMVRYIYIKMGNIFSYDYRVMVDMSKAQTKIDYSSSYISRFQTCYQINEILEIIINGLNTRIKAKIVPRVVPNQRYLDEHVALEVAFADNLKILLDLTLDLYKIQAGMQTSQFGYATNSLGEYDIISLKECEAMDKKIGLLKGEYTDSSINLIRERVSVIKGDNIKENIDTKIRIIKNELSKNFFGTHEASMYISYLITSILSPEELRYLKKFNLSFGTSDDLTLVTVFAFTDLNLYYSFSSDLGLEEVTLKSISNLLKCGWRTNSETLKNLVGTSKMV